jgi:hypothetical protein
MTPHGNAEFEAKRSRLITLAESIASVVHRTDYWDSASVSKTLNEAATILKSSAPLEDKRSAGARIRGLFHKEGFHDYPPQNGFEDWDSAMDELFSLSTIYAETRYRSFVSPPIQTELSLENNQAEQGGA